MEASERTNDPRSLSAAILKRRASADDGRRSSREIDRDGTRARTRERSREINRRDNAIMTPRVDAFLTSLTSAGPFTVNINPLNKWRVIFITAGANLRAARRRDLGYSGVINFIAGYPAIVRARGRTRETRD